MKSQYKIHNYFYTCWNGTIRFSDREIRYSRLSLCFFVLPVLFVFLQVVFFNGWSTGEIRHSGEGVEKCVWRGSLHCTEWSLTVMQTPMFPWKPLSTTEYTRAIFEPFVHLINYVFVPKAAWLDCLIMY